MTLIVGVSPLPLKKGELAHAQLRTDIKGN